MLRANFMLERLGCNRIISPARACSQAMQTFIIWDKKFPTSTRSFSVHIGLIPSGRQIVNRHPLDHYQQPTWVRVHIRQDVRPARFTDHRE